MGDRRAVEARRGKILTVVFVGTAVVLTALLVHDGIQAVRTLRTGYFPSFLFTTYLQSLKRLPRSWEIVAVATLPAISLMCSGLIALWGLLCRFGRGGRIRYSLVAVGAALLATNIAACYLILKAYVAI